jgi:hypothetical protein
LNQEILKRTASSWQLCFAELTVMEKGGEIIGRSLNIANAGWSSVGKYRGNSVKEQEVFSAR